MNLRTLLEMAASAEPDRVAIGSRDGGMSYGRLAAVATSLGAALRGDGSEVVALLDINSEATALLLFAAGAAGKPFAPMNFRLTDDQINDLVGRLSPVTVVVDEQFRGRVRPADGVTVRGRDELLGLAASAADAVPEFVDPESAAVLLATSGTTGEPKEAVLRHRHLASYVITTLEFWSAGEDEAILVSVPNYHIAGITSVLSSVYSGRRMVLLPQFSPQGWVELAAREKVTHAMVVPTMLGRVLDVLEECGETLPALRHLSYGGGRMPAQVVQRALSTLPHVGFVNAYGLTETSSTIAVLGPDDHREAIASQDPAVRARLGSVGRPLPTIEVEVRDDDGAVVGPDVSGEVFVRGEQVSGEYRSHSALDADGWYRTSDRGRIDGAGFLYLEGRADDVIVRGGENMSPGEIEDALLLHPAVREVAVVGVPDVEWGERVEAVVVPAPDTRASAEELQHWVRERLRGSKVPARVHWAAQLPYNETGKLLRRQIVAGLSSPQPAEVAP